MDKTDRLRDYGLAFLLYEQGLGLCGYELIRELFIFVQLILNSYLNIFVTHNAFGIFSEYSHISRRSGKPKIPYPNKKVALRAAEAMGKKHGVHFSVYKCAWCDGWHIGKNAQNKIKSDALENKALVSEDANKCLMFDY